jgi:hypothetical protein
MANVLSPLIPKLLAQGLIALRQQAIMPRLVNRGYESLAGEKGSTITIPVSSAIAAQAVSPANTPPATADTAPGSVTLTMSNWYEAPFYLTDKDLLEVDKGIIPMQASEAIKSLIANPSTTTSWRSTRTCGASPARPPSPRAPRTSTDVSRGPQGAQQPAGADGPALHGDQRGRSKRTRSRCVRFRMRRSPATIDGIINGQINNKLGARWLLEPEPAVAHRRHRHRLSGQQRPGLPDRVTTMTR